MPRVREGTNTGAEEFPALRPYEFHGVELGPPDRKGEANGPCPFCGKEEKFYVSGDTGQYKCFVCAEEGNALTFLRRLHEEGERVTTDLEVAEITLERGLLEASTLKDWGVVKSPLTGDWLLPGYNPAGKLTQLYSRRRVREKATGADGKVTWQWRWVQFPTPGLDPTQERHGIHGVPLMDARATTLYLCEGAWDGMALWEMLCQTKSTGRGLEPTGAPDSSLLAGAAVLAVPGAGIFPEAWLSLISGKRLITLYDSDNKANPRTGEPIRAGYAGTKRVVEMTPRAEIPPLSVEWLEWGPEGYDPDKPSGYDVRDALREGGDTLESRLPALSALLGKIKPVPSEWLPGRTTAAALMGGTEIELLPCQRWDTLITAWRKAMRWTPGLDAALACMLAAVTSTKAVGDQLWFKIIGPASCGKTTLCEALSLNRQHVVAKSTIRGFHSGWRGEGAATTPSSPSSTTRRW